MLVTAQSSRRSASLFHLGNIAVVLMPFPLLVFWFGASIFVYAHSRHHPEPKVRKYTQRAANRFYLMAGVTIVIGKFIPRDSSETFQYFFLLWLFAVFTVLIPSVWDIYRIWRDKWVDIDIGNPG